MSRNYSAAGQSASGTALKTAVALRCTTVVRQGVWGIETGPYLAPNATDHSFIASLSKSTAQGTSAASAPTPIAIDPGDVPSLTVVEWTNSAEPTYQTSDAWSKAGNQRSSPQWNGYDGREIWSAAGAATGIGLRLLSTTAATTYQLNGTLFWRE